MDVMNILIEENIRIPGSADDLPGIIEALDKKREFYEGLTEDDIEKPQPKKGRRN
eukprot:CAMPEP_0168314852 /NCGR_PEP_ID=MMETSP0210-20121227/9599_1 /TAXON_ID=40633 /ORGANISM="Condylostoma magnum, Strain COL2" /LENGTH=54 /DNA_ID=CAMNT_0008285311 /DNA_START=1369 /DNA_END=1533 /DNA_ORIENTATION=-